MPISVRRLVTVLAPMPRGQRQDRYHGDDGRRSERADGETQILHAGLRDVALGF